MSTPRYSDVDRPAIDVVRKSCGTRRGAWAFALAFAVVGSLGGGVADATGHAVTGPHAARAAQAPVSSTRMGGAGMDMCAPATGPGGTTAPMIMDEGGLQMEMYPTSCTPPTWAELDRVHTMLARVKAATDKYRDFNVAVRDGYYPASVAFVQGQGYHYANPAYLGGIGGRGFDLLHPPFLVYDKVAGKLVLRGLMYYVPATTTAQQLAAIFPPSMAGWHRHLNLCLRAGGVLHVYTDAACAKAGGFFLPSTGWMVHAWLWRPDSGVFAIDM